MSPGSIQPQNGRPKNRYWVLWLGVVLLGLFAISAFFVTRMIDRKMREEFLQQTKIFAAALEINKIMALQGSPADRHLAEFRELEAMFGEMLRLSPTFRYVYLARHTEKGAVLLIDVQDDAREETAPVEPGTTYEDASEEFLRLLTDPEADAFVEGPLADSYGSWVSALVPIYHPQTGEVVCVFGIDKDSQSWNGELFFRSVPILALIAVLLIAVFTVVYLRSQVVMTTSDYTVSRRLLMPTSLALILLVGGFLWLFVWQQKRVLDNSELTAAQRVHGSLEIILEERARFLRATIEVLRHTPLVIQMLAEGQREKILSSNERIWDGLRKEAGIDLFYLISLDGRAILRVHEPRKYGDEILDEVFLNTKNTGEITTGLALSRRGRPALRTAAPVYSGEKLIGYIEIASSLSGLLAQLHTAGRVEIIATIWKRYVENSKDVWLSNVTEQSVPEKWKSFPSQLVFYSSSRELPAPVGEILHTGEENMEPKDSEGWHITRLPLKSSSGEEFGNLFILLHTEHLELEFRRFLTVAIAFAATLCLGLIAFVYVALRRTDQIILARKSELMEANRELAEREAQAAKYAREAEAATRAKSEYLAFMSHEIRNPLNGIIGLTSLLKESQLDEDQSEIVAQMDKSSREMLRLINDVLDLSKIEAGRMELEHVAFDPAELVRECAAVHGLNATAKGLEFHTEIAPGLPAQIRGDPTRLRQVLNNLLSNALKFTQNGSITLRLISDTASGNSDLQNASRLRFEVADTGVGISPEACAKIFEKYQQADSATSRRFGGTGLGLAISREIVRAMGGEIGVQSEPGKGSTFWVVIPSQVPEQDASQKQQT